MKRNVDNQSQKRKHDDESDSSDISSRPSGQFMREKCLHELFCLHFKQFAFLVMFDLVYLCISCDERIVFASNQVLTLNPITGFCQHQGTITVPGRLVPRNLLQNRTILRGDVLFVMFVSFA